MAPGLLVKCQVGEAPAAGHNLMYIYHKQCEIIEKFNEKPQSQTQTILVYIYHKQCEIIQKIQ